MAGSNTILNRLQAFFGISKSEITFVAILLSGLLIGASVKYFGSGETVPPPPEDVYRILDSLAEVQKTTFTASDMQGNPDSLVAAGDTIVKNESYFPQAAKKKVASGVININTASKVELMRLPGIGESTAQKIIDHRNTSPFRQPSDIMKIKGIGEKKYEKMKQFIVVG